MSRVRRGILASFADKYLSQLLGVLTIAVTSRLMTPAEIGLYLVANSVILLADNFRTFGVGIYIVQVPELRRENLQAAFTVTFVLSLAIGGAIYAAADPLARFYEAAGLAELLRVATLAFCAIPFGSAIVALLQRDLAFGTLAWLNVSAALTNAAVTVTLALAGFGPVSFVWGYVASSTGLAIAAVAVRPDFGIFRPSLHQTGRILGFGSLSTAVAIVNLVNDMLPRLAFGKILGFDAAGLYGRALTICQLPDRAVLAALQPVVLPAMAAHVRAGGELRLVYLRGLALVSAVQWPLLLVLALLADPVVRILLGPQWDAAAPLLRLMALAMMALAPAFMTFPVLVTAGRLRDTLWSSLIAVPPSMALMIGAAHLGIGWAAASLLVTAPFQMYVALWFVRRAIGLGWPDLAGAARQSLAVAASAGAVPAAIVVLSPRGFDLGWTETAVAVAGAATGWLAGLVLSGHPLKDEIAAVWRMALPVLRPRRAGAPPPAE